MNSDNARRIRLLKVKQFIEQHSWCREGGLRRQIFNAEENGLRDVGAIVRIGRKVLLDEAKYFDRVQSQQKH